MDSVGDLMILAYTGLSSVAEALTRQIQLTDSVNGWMTNNAIILHANSRGLQHILKEFETLYAKSVWYAAKAQLFFREWMN